MITADLHDEPEFANVSRPRVARLMKDMGLKCKTVRKFIVTTDSKHDEPVAPNILNRQFKVPAPDIAWVGDITYVKVGRKWYYLTVFIDLFSRLVHHVRYRNPEEAERSLFNYIVVYYNRQKKHSTNGYKAPALHEQEWWEKR